jgi:hypothetical protein
MVGRGRRFGLRLARVAFGAAVSAFSRFGGGGRVSVVDVVDDGNDGRRLPAQGLRPFDPTRGTLALPRDPLAFGAPSR